MSGFLRASLVTAVVLILPDWAYCQATPQGCQHVITALPTTIRTSGHWCIEHDFYLPYISAGAAIVVLADSVTVDLGGYRVKGGDAPLPQRAGVSISGNSVTVQNGTLMGFDTGVLRQQGFEGTVVRDLAMSVCKRGILLNASPEGRGVDSIQRCKIIEAEGPAITIYSHRATVLDNLILGAFPTGILAVGSVLIQGNYVCGHPDVYPSAVGIDATGSVCRDNTVVNVLTPYNGCVMVGTNYP